MKRTKSSLSKRRAWPVFLGLVAVAVGIFPESNGVADETTAQEGKTPSEGASMEKSATSQRHPLTRYESLWQRSLFHTPVQKAVADPAFAREYSLAGIFEMNGSTTAALVRKRDNMVVNVSDADEADDGADGLKLISVETSGGATGTRVQVEKSGVRAWIVATPATTSGVAPRASSAVAPVVSPVDSRAADTSEFSDWEDFTGTRSGVPASELPRQNDGSGTPAATQPALEVPVPSPPKVKQPVPVPPSPLDAAMAADEKEIVVPIEE